MRVINRVFSVPLIPPVPVRRLVLVSDDIVQVLYVGMERRVYGAVALVENSLDRIAPWARAKHQNISHSWPVISLFIRPFNSHILLSIVTFIQIFLIVFLFVFVTRGTFSEMHFFCNYYSLDNSIYTNVETILSSKSVIREMKRCFIAPIALLIFNYWCPLFWHVFRPKRITVENFFNSDRVETLHRLVDKLT